MAIVQARVMNEVETWRVIESSDVEGIKTHHLAREGKFRVVPCGLVDIISIRPSVVVNNPMRAGKQEV